MVDLEVGGPSGAPLIACSPGQACGWPSLLCGLGGGVAGGGRYCVYVGTIPGGKGLDIVFFLPHVSVFLSAAAAHCTFPGPRQDPQSAPGPQERGWGLVQVLEPRERAMEVIKGGG